MPRAFTAALSAALVAATLSGCTGFFFQPMRPWVQKPEELGIKVDDVRIPTADGLHLSAWYLPASDKALATILFLHGNAENISTHIGSVYWLPAQGFNVLAIDYRGYGASEGTPSVPGAEEDIDSAVRYLLARPDVDPNNLVVLGQSLGGALGMYYVAHSEYRSHIRAVVIDSAFIGYRDIAREKLESSWVTWLLAWPLGFTVTDDYRPLDAAPELHPIPVLFIRGDRDVVVPPNHSKLLYDAAKEPKALWIVPGAGHIQSLSHPDVRRRLVEWLREQLNR